MTDHKTLAIESIIRAEADLKNALANLEALPVFDPSCVLLAAHSLNNYMSVISGTVELLLLRLRGRTDEDVLKLIENLGHSNELMRQTVNRLTHSSVVQDVTFVHKEVDLPNLVSLACDHYRRVAKDKQIGLEYVNRTTLQYVWTDAVAVAAILDNLLSNAVKYSPSGTRIEVTLSDDGESALCTVADQGPGISEADQAKLFNKGVTFGHRPTAGEPSTGYGLAVALEIVQKLGGTIGCRSREGHGATFFFRIPIS